ncbi:CvpA family protein [Psittacicella gerlachiana]|uniref:Membrane protein required for colicin V production n=1 Tax=Psittacicella gerlachiana TaxID=2028574 RepID=A0A3A1Y8U5_9GAMM|nr:CvpA family protein [Psittacicella gerlachiana]RIY34733.1 hypothetical protein CKF59_04920 [Psittacicella gerlachiana]
MFSIADLFLGIIVLVFFVKGFLRGFLGSIFTLIALGGAIFVALNFTGDFSPLLNKVPYTHQYPLLAFAIVFIVSYIFLSLATKALTALFAGLTVLNNPFLSLLGGVILAFVAICVISVIYSFLVENGVNPGSFVKNFDQSYAKEVIDYFNSGLNINARIKELFAAFSEQAKLYK